MVQRNGWKQILYSTEPFEGKERFLPREKCVGGLGTSGSPHVSELEYEVDNIKFTI